MARSGGFKYKPTMSRTPHELWIFGILEVLHTMRLQSDSMPDPNDGILRQLRLIGHQTSAPVGDIGWNRFQGLVYNLFNLFIRDLARCTDSRLTLQAVPPKLAKAFPRLADRRAGDVQFMQRISRSEH
jgi:hypothetical protein